MPPAGHAILVACVVPVTSDDGDGGLPSREALQVMPRLSVTWMLQPRSQCRKPMHLVMDPDNIIEGKAAQEDTRAVFRL